MVSFALTTLTIALATLITAAPTPSTTEFSFALQAEGYPVLSLAAINAKAIGNKNLVFERPSAYPALLPTSTKHFSNSTLPITTTQVRLGFGNGSGTKGFSISNGELVAPKTAALQSFFACDSTLQGVESLALKWGVYQSNGKAPEGCVAAKLVQNYNVEY